MQFEANQAAPAIRSRDEAWYALYTKHQHEKKIAQTLSFKRFKIFLPLYQTSHQWKDRNKLLSLPLFPSYVFIQGGLDRSLEILTTPGLFGFVLMGSQPAAIPTSEIDAVRRAVERAGGIEPHPFLKCGDLVRVKSGPLSGIEGVLVRKKNLYKLVLSVEMLERSVAVEIEAGIVERVSRRNGHEAPDWLASNVPACGLKNSSTYASG